jgi:hypothetical protein
VIRRRLVEVVAEKPAIGQIQAELARQSTLRSDAVEVADEQHLEDHDGVDGRLTGVTVERLAEATDEGEVDTFSDATKQVIFGDQAL